jgi:hypothetical protein
LEALTLKTNPLDPPAFALTRDGNPFHTTIAKTLDDLAENEAKKRAARRCSERGKYRTHEDLDAIAIGDGDTPRLCPAT